MFKLGEDSGLVLLFNVHQGYATRRSDSEIIFRPDGMSDDDFNKAIIDASKKLIIKNKDLIDSNPYGGDTQAELRVEYESLGCFVSLSKKILLGETKIESFKTYVMLAAKVIKLIQEV